jgi:hypothetical protein
MNIETDRKYKVLKKNEAPSFPQMKVASKILSSARQKGFSK